MNHHFLLFYFIMICGTQLIFGQTTNNPPAPSPADRQVIEQIREKEIQELDKLTRQSATGRISSRPTEKPLTKAEREKIKKIITPEAEDFARYKEFLRQPKTGLFRLFPDFDCESKNLVRVGGACENFVAGAWGYSFRQKFYADPLFHDLSFKNGSFGSHGLLTQGILVSLGDTPLENISLAAREIKYLVDFKPASELQSAREQYREIDNGVEYENYRYSKSVRVEVNTTYAMRVIAYDYRDKLISRFRNDRMTPSDINFLKLQYDKRKDLLLIFRVVRKAEDGGVTILWRELYRQDPPKLIFQKTEKLTDFKTTQ